MRATGPAGTTIAIRCCFVRSCTRTDCVALTSNRPIVQSRSPHSIISSAAASSAGGRVRPSVLRHVVIQAVRQQRSLQPVLAFHETFHPAIPQ